MPWSSSAHRVSRPSTRLPRWLALGAALLLAATGGAGLRAQGGPPQGLPEQAMAAFDGELEVRYEEWRTGARLRQFLRTDDGERLELQFSGSPTDLLNGSRIRAHGVRQGGTLMLTDGS